MKKVFPFIIDRYVTPPFQIQSTKIIRRSLFFVCLLFCTRVSVNAQSKIHGQVVDSVGKPIYQANVLLLTPKDSSLVKGIFTKEDGSYSFENIIPGKYLIASSHTGFKNSFIPIFQINDQQNLKIETIRLDEAAIQLKSVNISVKKPLYEQKIDRLVINVAGSITSAGSTALDVLERSPGIIVDRINNSLSINGKNGVIVMMNGKRNYMQMADVIQLLAGIPSGNIDRIEVITAPPANFDAEGNAGIINIVLKSNNQFGTNGFYTLSAGYDKGEQNSFSLNINHRKGRVNLFGNYSFSRTRLKQLWRNYHAVTYQGNFIENYSESNRNALASQHNGQVGIDYEINKKTIIGALFSASNRNWDMEANNNAFTYSNYKQDTSLKIVNNEIHTTSNYSFNINLQHTFKVDEKININLDYLKYNDNNPSRYINAYFDNLNNFVYDEKVKSSKTTPLKFWVGAADYSKKLSKKTDMEAGIKGAVSMLSNDVSVATLFQNNWLQDASLSGYHNLHENITAVYSSFSIAIDSATSVKAGLRYEYTNSNLGSPAQKNIVDRHYGNLFPSFFILHTINKNNAINFSYSRRIWRPGFTDLAPWVLFYDPKTFQTGNPALQPSIADALNASYTYKNKIVSLSYSYTKNPIILQPKIIESSNKMIISLANGKNIKDITVNLSLPFTVTKWWNMQNNISAGWRQSNVFYKTGIKTESKSFWLNTAQNFVLPKDISFELSGFYYAGGNWGFYKYSPAGSLNLGIQKKFIKNRSTLSFNIRNILNTLTFQYSAYKPEQNLIQKNRSDYSYTNCSLSFTHNFGNDKVKGKRERLTGAEDEKGRAN